MIARPERDDRFDGPADAPPSCGGGTLLLPVRACAGPVLPCSSVFFLINFRIDGPGDSPSSSGVSTFLLSVRAFAGNSVRCFLSRCLKYFRDTLQNSVSFVSSSFCFCSSSFCFVASSFCFCASSFWSLSFVCCSSRMCLFLSG